MTDTSGTLRPDEASEGDSGAEVPSSPGPIEDSYWAAPRLLAGPHPLLDTADRAAQRAAIRALLEAEIRTVIDLRTPAETPSIRSLLGKLGGSDVAWVGTPILDGAAPEVALTQLILDLIDSALERERGVYVHCQGGRGRAGTIIACWWIRHGIYTPGQTLSALTARRAGLLHGAHPSPETGAQHRRIAGWRPGQ